MNNKADLATLLAETSGSARHRRPVAERSATPKAKGPQPKGSEEGPGLNSPITLHFPKQVRKQLKILAVEHETTLHNLAAEALNDLFAKYGKPEIAPTQAQHAE
jgi:hypothetical protein